LGRAATAAAPALPRLQLNGALWLRRAVVVAWIVAGTAVLLLVLSRLFAAAVPVPDGGNAGAGSQFGSGGGSQFVPGASSQFVPGAGNPYLNQYYAVPGRRRELTLPPSASQVP